MSATRRRRRSGGAALVSYTPGGPTPAGFSFTRPSVARQFDQNGIEQVLGANLPRDGHYAGAYRTLYLTDGDAIGGAGWGTNGVGEVVTPGQTDSQGGTAACLIQANGNGAGCTQHNLPAIMGADGNPRTLSVDVKQGTSPECRMTLYDGVAVAHRGYISVVFNGSAPPTLAVITGTVTLGAPINLGGGWWRIPWTVTAGLLANISSLICYPDPNLGSRNCYFGRPQVEAGSVATAYTPITVTAPQIRYPASGRGLYLERGRVNSCLWSRDLTQAAWAVSGAGTRTFTGTGPDGSANSCTVLSDTDATALYYLIQAITVPVDTNTHAILFLVRKDGDQSRFVGFDCTIQGGTVVERIVQLNTVTGAIINTAAPTGTTTARSIDMGLWWGVEITLTNNGTALNTNLNIRIRAAAGTVFGTDSVAATGTCTIGHVQVELNAPFSSSLITTGAAIASRADETPLFGTIFAEQALTAYISGIDMGSAASAGSTGIGSIGDFNIKPAVVIYYATPGVPTAAFHNGTAQVNAGTVASGIVSGDSVEFRATLDPTGSVQPFYTRNGGAEVLIAASAGQAFGAGWGGSQSRLNDYDGTHIGFMIYKRFVVLPGLHNLPEMRAA